MLHDTDQSLWLWLDNITLASWNELLGVIASKSAALRKAG